MHLHTPVAYLSELKKKKCFLTQLETTGRRREEKQYRAEKEAQKA